MGERLCLASLLGGLHFVAWRSGADVAPLRSGRRLVQAGQLLAFSTGVMVAAD